MAEGKRCHGGETKMVPRQHIRKCHGNISVPVAHGDTVAKEVWREQAKDGGVLPDTGFPRVDGMANEEELAMTIRTRCNMSISYNTHSFAHERSTRRLYL